MGSPEVLTALLLQRQCSNSWSFPPCWVSASPGNPQYLNTMTSFSGPPSAYKSTVLSGPSCPPFQMQRPTLSGSLRCLQLNVGGLRAKSNKLFLFILLYILCFLSVFKNLTLTRPLFGFLNTLLCDLIPPTPGVAFFLLMIRTRWYHHFLASFSGLPPQRTAALYFPEIHWNDCISCFKLLLLFC